VSCKHKCCTPEHYCRVQHCSSGAARRSATTMLLHVCLNIEMNRTWCWAPLCLPAALQPVADADCWRGWVRERCRRICVLPWPRLLLFQGVCRKAVGMQASREKQASMQQQLKSITLALQI
jgi:hypothetical protein